MRYLGNKDSIVDQIKNLLAEKNLLNENLVFFDAFCGTGAVADYFKDIFNIKINDILSCMILYAKGRIASKDCTFEKLGFDPIEYLNSNLETRQGFVYKNYSPAESERMYFTSENAGRIDYFRKQIEEWKEDNKINDDEYNYLLACLIDSVSFVSNTAGVYGAFLKKWDSRALKPIQFLKVTSNPANSKSLVSYNSKIEDIISDVECDILYLDPPYTQNQYGTQYHLLETLILNDNPEISKVTGSRYTAPYRSDWSKEYKAHILFDKIIEKTKAKYILFSYNNDGFLSNDFIEASLKRYGKEETFVCKKISYKKYQNWKTSGKENHYEYLFFIEKKSADEITYDCPLNYTGSKSKMVKKIKENIPLKSTFIDLFGGGFNVGINAKSNHIVYNDINYIVKDLIQSFKNEDTYKYLLAIKNYTKKFSLEKGNADSYKKAREYYNNLPQKKRDSKLLFTLIMYGFQQQIRFNSNHDFNNPAGNRWFNDFVLEKFISFSKHIKEIDCEFTTKNFLDFENISDNDIFFYMDPPYRMTTGVYNDGKRGFDGWTFEHEQKLLSFADDLTKHNIPFILSYVIEYNGQTNQNILAWVKKNSYTVIAVDGQGRYANRKEVLIKNYA